jgi:hypothetical protein
VAIPVKGRARLVGRGVADIEATVSFHEKLGMGRETFGDGRVALRFGEQKINLHQLGAEFGPNAAHVLPGTADLRCNPSSLAISSAPATIDKIGTKRRSRPEPVRLGSRHDRTRNRDGR